MSTRSPVACVEMIDAKLRDQRTGDVEARRRCRSRHRTARGPQPPRGCRASIARGDVPIALATARSRRRSASESDTMLYTSSPDSPSAISRPRKSSGMSGPRFVIHGAGSPGPRTKYVGPAAAASRGRNASSLTPASADDQDRVVVASAVEQPLRGLQVEDRDASAVRVVQRVVDDRALDRDAALIGPDVAHLDRRARTSAADMSDRAVRPRRSSSVRRIRKTRSAPRPGSRRRSDAI